MDCIRIEPARGRRADAAIIWLHGLGADGNDFVPIIPELGLPPGHSVRFIFPHAPAQAISINGGYVMRAWYDVRHPDLRKAQDTRGIAQSRVAIDDLIDQEIADGIASGRILLAGFSQGGVMALVCGLQRPEALAGIVALSCYLALPETLATASQTAGLRTPVFLAHGTEDAIIPIEAGIDARDRLIAAGVDVQWRRYPMAHGVSAAEVDDIGQFIQRCLPTATSA